MSILIIIIHQSLKEFTLTIILVISHTIMNECQGFFIILHTFFFIKKIWETRTTNLIKTVICCLMHQSDNLRFRSISNLIKLLRCILKINIDFLGLQNIPDIIISNAPYLTISTRNNSVIKEF